MQKLNLENYRSQLELPRIDDKLIVYTFKVTGENWGQVEFLDLKDGNRYEGKFYLAQEETDSEVLINFDCNGCGFTIEENPEQVLGFDDFIDSMTKPYIIEKG